MERRDSSHFEADVYIIKVERNLFKIDEQLLHYVPRLNRALADGELQLGRPYNLDFPCQPRILKDVLQLLKRQTDNLDPFEGFQSAQQANSHTILEMIQLLQLADSLEIVRLGCIIVDKIRSLCADTSSLRDALKGTRFERYLDVDQYSHRIFDGQAQSYQDHNEVSLVSTDLEEPASQSQPKSAQLITKRKMSKLPLGFEPESKRTRKVVTHTPTQGTSTNISSSPKQVLLGEPSSDQPVSSSESVDSEQLYSDQTDHKLDEEDLEADDDGMEIDEDDFERDEDGIDVVEQDSFQLDEEEVTSDDIEELVKSDPVKFECLSSPPQSLQKSNLSTLQNHVLVPSSPPTPSREARMSVASVARDRDQTKQEKISSMHKIRLLPASKLAPIPAPRLECAKINSRKEVEAEGSLSVTQSTDTQSLLTPSFELEQFLSKALSKDFSGLCGSIFNDHLAFYSGRRTFGKTPFIKMNYSNIVQFKVADCGGEPPLVQILLRGSDISANICYLVFKSHSSLTEFVEETRRRYSNLRVIQLRPGSAKTLLSAAENTCKSMYEASTPTQKNKEPKAKTIDIVEIPDDDELPDMHDLLSPRRKSRFIQEPAVSQTQHFKTSSTILTTKRKLFNQIPPSL